MNLLIGITTILAQATAPAGPTAPTEAQPFSLPWTKYLVPLTFAVIIAVITVELVRRRKLREEYAMIWLAVSAVLLIIGIFPQIVIWLQDLLRMHYLTIVVLGLFSFLAVIMLHFSIVISRQSDQIRRLTQELAMMKRQLEDRQTPKPGLNEPAKQPGQADGPTGDNPSRE
ncbi:MAG: DUF2304 domain-containing protein [Planctomycetes bacterium]|nr:DUF2304 domain-containing protein [Planctomycetota bacterium]